jgi:natural product biosynthesis luciferase-like monooxygenase protein
MEFGLMFFSSLDEPAAGDKYGLLLEAARFADAHGFCCVWTPERHFHEFGGLFPNPSIVCAALATITDRIELRAGSLISPLHNTLRIAEEWSMIDNLSHGRAAISFGSGWNAEDFVFFPERYAERQAFMYRQIEEVRDLWRGKPLRQTDSFGHQVEVAVFPRPVRQELPVWVTSAGNERTFASAGAIGANLLTHLIGQDPDGLAGKIETYREAREAHGFSRQAGVVSLMLHTFLGADRDVVKQQVRVPFREYLRSAIRLEQIAAAAGGAISGGHRIEPHEVTPAVFEELLDLTFERYFERAALMGTPASCASLIDDLRAAGVDEIACLVDFMSDRDAVRGSLGYLAALRGTIAAAESASIASQSALLRDGTLAW